MLDYMKLIGMVPQAMKIMKEKNMSGTKKEVLEMLDQLKISPEELKNKIDSFLDMPFIGNKIKDSKVPIQKIRDELNALCSSRKNSGMSGGGSLPRL